MSRRSSSRASAFSVFVAALLAVLAILPASLPARAAVDTDGDGLYNAFELNKSHTDPLRADSNGNGIPDGAEDPDGDGLSNWGEQRFHTAPLNADTDADGRPDGLDDADHNGVPDGVEQDLGRPVPADLRPSLDTAAKDTPVSYVDGCHVEGWEHAFRECDYATPNAPIKIALFGDSHSAQWLPALIKLGNQHGWTIQNLTRSACPSADVHMYSVYQHGADTWCSDYRTQALAWLNANPPDLILMSNFGGQRMVDANGVSIPLNERGKLWRQGFSRTIAALPATSRVLVLADTPTAAVSPIGCLRANPTSFGVCERSRAVSIPSAYNAIDAAVAARRGAAFADLNGVACSYDPCPILVGNVLLYRGRGHFSATFSRSIAPALNAVLEPQLPH